MSESLGWRESGWKSESSDPEGIEVEERVVAPEGIEPGERVVRSEGIEPSERVAATERIRQKRGADLAREPVNVIESKSPRESSQANES